MTFWPLTCYSDFLTDHNFHLLHDLNTELDLHRFTSGLYGAFAMGLACQQGTLTRSDTWFRSPFLGLAYAPIDLSPFSWHVAFHVAFLTSFYCDVTIAPLSEGPFDCDVIMMKSANRCNVGPLAIRQLLRPDFPNLCLYSAFHLEYPIDTFFSFLLLKIKTLNNSWKFVPSHMNTIYCLNNIFHYYVQLSLTTLFHQLHTLHAPYQVS